MPKRARVFNIQNALQASFSEQSLASLAEQENMQWEPLIRDILLSEACYFRACLFLKFCL